MPSFFQRVIGPVIFGLVLVGCGSQPLNVDRPASPAGAIAPTQTAETISSTPGPSPTSALPTTPKLPPTGVPGLRPPAPEPTDTMALTATPTGRPAAPTPGPTASLQPPTPMPTNPPPSPTPAPEKQPKLDCSPHSFPQRTQQSLAVDPTDDQRLYIGVEQAGFFKSTDGGQTWQKASAGIKAWERLDGTGLCYEEFYSTIVSPTDPDRICMSMAGGPGTLALPTSAGNNGVYCSNDGAENWEQRVGATMNAAVYALAADPRDFSTMYAGVNGGPCTNLPPVCAPETYFNTTGAIYKTTDGGATWSEMYALYQRDLRVISVQVDWDNPDVVVAATFSKISGPGQASGNFADAPQLGLLRSVDGGQTWSSSTDGMSDDPREMALLGMKTAPGNGSRMYLTASSNTSYWSEDGGRSFHSARRMAAFAFNPHEPTGLILLGSSGGSVSESVDGGRTWTPKGEIPDFSESEDWVPTNIEWGSQDPNVVYMSGPYAQVLKSTDGGATWRQVLSSAGLPLD